MNVLENVAHCPGFEAFEGTLFVWRLRQDDDFSAREPSFEEANGLRQVKTGDVLVEENNVWIQRVEQLQGLGDAACLRHEVDTSALLEEAAEALSNEGGVVHDQDA
jgi:diphthamide synthase (EF-2-diphthine--ammonia ligase)